MLKNYYFHIHELTDGHKCHSVKISHSFYFRPIHLLSSSGFKLATLSLQCIMLGLLLKLSLDTDATIMFKYQIFHEPNNEIMKPSNSWVNKGACARQNQGQNQIAKTQCVKGWYLIRPLIDFKRNACFVIV